MDKATYDHLRSIAISDERRHLTLIKNLIMYPYSDWTPPAHITRKLRRETGLLQPIVTNEVEVDRERTETMQTEVEV